MCCHEPNFAINTPGGEHKRRVLVIGSFFSPPTLSQMQKKDHSQYFYIETLTSILSKILNYDAI